MEMFIAGFVSAIVLAVVIAGCLVLRQIQAPPMPPEEWRS